MPLLRGNHSIFKLRLQSFPLANSCDRISHQRVRFIFAELLGASGFAESPTDHRVRRAQGKLSKLVLGQGLAERCACNLGTLSDLDRKVNKRYRNRDAADESPNVAQIAECHRSSPPL